MLVHLQQRYSLPHDMLPVTVTLYNNEPVLGSSVQSKSSLSVLYWHHRALLRLVRCHVGRHFWKAEQRRFRLVWNIARRVTVGVRSVMIIIPGYRCSDVCGENSSFATLSASSSWKQSSETCSSWKTDLRVVLVSVQEASVRSEANIDLLPKSCKIWVSMSYICTFLKDHPLLRARFRRIEPKSLIFCRIVLN